MKKDFPEKIFETGPHNTFFNHFRVEGMSPKLTEKFVKSWDMTLEAKPDSITITNFFDIVENSRVLPSYEMDDILMKISEYYISIWKKIPPPETQQISLYVGNYTNVIIGEEAAFEVIGFPFKSANKKISVHLEICDTNGKLLHSFPKEDILLDSIRILKYSLATLPYADCRAFFPRLKYSVNGKEFVASSYPPTMLVTSLRPHFLMWCRSINNMIDIDEGIRYWTLNGAHSGETAVYPENGIAVINSNLASNNGPRFNQGGGHVRLLRNGMEIDSFKSNNLKFNKIFNLPDPGYSLDYYNLELENSKGGRYLSPSIWVSKNLRNFECVIPVFLSDNKITDAKIEAGRVPFFYYPCNQDSGNLLVDYSGYDHHGILGAGISIWQRQLQRTGYRHEHLDSTNPVLAQDAPEFKKDENGRGFLHFIGSSNSCGVIMGGTAFPYAFTYEVTVKPEIIGKKQGIIGTPSGQLNIELTKDGKLCAWRDYRIKDLPEKKGRSEILSREKLDPGKWYRIAVVYDLKKLSLYIDGQFQGDAASVPDRDHERMNIVTIGSLCAYPWNPVEFFTGDIKDVRIYGRNLKIEEFLK
jgi:hypothetical protein